MRHYLFGSSTAHRTEECPAWVEQSEGLPRADSSFAMDGTVIHQLLENAALIDQYRMEDQLGKLVVDDHPRVTAEHLQMAQEMWAATRQLLDEYGAIEYEAETTGTAAADVGGTLDMIADCGDTALLIDYKTGMGVQVDAVNNRQILFAAAVCQESSEASDMLDGKDKFVGIIIQPNRAGEVAVKRWEFDQADIAAFWEGHLQKIELARQGGLTPVAGDHCKFCPANGLCDATTGNLLRMARLDDKNLEQLAWGLDHIEQVKDTIKNIEKRAYEQLEVGAEIPGWKLVRGRPGNTRWIDQGVALARLRRMLGGKKHVVKEQLLSPAQVIALAKTIGNLSAVKPVVDELTERPPATKNTLAPASDPRPAVLSASGLSAALDSLK